MKTDHKLYIEIYNGSDQLVGVYDISDFDKVVETLQAGDTILVKER